MRETKLERYLVDSVERMGGWAPKFTSPGHAGVPDRIVMLPGGGVGFLELKAPGAAPRQLQQRQMSRIAALGVPVAWASSESGVDAFLAALQAARK